VYALVRLGEIDRAEQALASIGERDRDRGEMRVAAAVLRLTQDDPDTATVALAPVLDGSARAGWRSWVVEAFLLKAIARDALGDQDRRGGRPGARARSRRARRDALVVLAAPRAGPARAPGPPAHRAPHPDRPHPRPADARWGAGGHGGAGGLGGIVPLRLAKLTPPQ